jgi:hypothetical protein
MSRAKGYERGNFGGSSNPLEDRHLKPVAEAGKLRTLMLSDNELKSLLENNGKGTLKKYLYGQPLAVGETISLHSEQEIIQAKVTAIPQGLAAENNKSTLIEVELILDAKQS